MLENSHEISYLVATILVGLGVAISGTAFLIPHINASLDSVMSPIMYSLYKRGKIALWTALAGLVLLVASAGMFEDSGFYQRFDGNEFNYARWIGYGAFYLAHAAVAASFLGLSLLDGWAAIFQAAFAATCFTFAGMSTHGRRYYWFAFGIFFWAMEMANLILYRHRERRKFHPDTVFIILSMLVFGFLAAVLLVSDDLLGWANVLKSDFMYAAATGAVGLAFPAYYWLMYEPMPSGLEAIPTDERAFVKGGKNY